MQAAPCDPCDSLASTRLYAQFLGRSSIVRLDLSTHFNSDSRDISEARAIGCPDAEGMAVDADVGEAVDAAVEFLKLRA